MKYRKKPIVIEAYQLPPNDDQTRRLPPPWLMQAVIDGQVQVLADPPCAHIVTLEGVMTANVGDWIIKGVKGEIYPCKPDIFAATYDAAE